MHGHPKCAFSPRLLPASRVRQCVPTPQVADSGYFARNHHEILYLQTPLVAKSLINHVFSARSHKGIFLLPIGKPPKPVQLKPNQFHIPVRIEVLSQTYLGIKPGGEGGLSSS